MTGRSNTPGDTATDWIPTAERMPEQADADPWGCVMIWDHYNGCMITGWQNHQRLEAEWVTHWARIPRGPEREERK